jgi:Tol biopolymer transport system component
MQNLISQETNNSLDELINAGNFDEAIQLCKGLLDDKPDDPILNFKVGYCYLNTILNKSKATLYLEKSVDLFKEINSQNILATEAKFYLGKSYHKNYDFEKAIDLFQVLRKEVKNKEMLLAIEEEIQQCNYGLQYRQHPVSMQITNMGNIINSSYSDHSPVVSADESVLIFTSRRKQFENELVKPDGQYNEDIYISNFNGEKWSAPKSISENINTEAHEASIGLSPDGQQLLIYRDLDGGTILVSNLIGNEWTTPASLGNNINTRYRETHATISADNKHLFFTSDRPGGFGGLDIYQSDMQPDGKWGKAVNLGPTVNTAKDEEGPYIHPDGITLYFSSKGHETMGGFDIFSCTKNEFGTWGKPENLGYPVNTTEDDAFITTTPDGKRAYFASYREGGHGYTDIYMMGLPEAEEKPVTVVKGVVAGCKSDIQKVQIFVYDSARSEMIGIYKPNSLTGKYLFVLTRGKNYEAVFQIDGKEVHVEDFHISNNADYQVIYKLIELKAQDPCNEYVGID